MTEREAIPTTERTLSTADRAEFIRWAFGLFGLQPRGDDCERDVHVAPYDGCYGRAGYVPVVNGSPPRATILIEPASGRLVAMRSALEVLVGTPPGKAPTARQVGNKLKAFRRRVLDGMLLDEAGSRTSKGAVWKLFGAPAGADQCI